MAPGVAILAAVIPEKEAGSVPVGNKPSGYAIKSGTSMACPHVTGAAAFIKSFHHGWSTSMIKSALMTTGTFEGRIHKDGHTLNTHSQTHTHSQIVTRAWGIQKGILA